jgi:hypothetical protein
MAAMVAAQDAGRHHRRAVAMGIRCAHRRAIRVRVGNCRSTQCTVCACLCVVILWQIIHLWHSHFLYSPSLSSLPAPAAGLMNSVPSRPAFQPATHALGSGSDPRSASTDRNAAANGSKRTVTSDATMALLASAPSRPAFDPFMGGGAGGGGGASGSGSGGGSAFGGNNSGADLLTSMALPAARPAFQPADLRGAGLHSAAAAAPAPSYPSALDLDLSRPRFEPNFAALRK